MSALAVACAVALTPMIDVPFEFWGISPHVSARKIATLERKADRAVVLIHGLKVQAINPAKATLPESHTFQKPGTELVKELERDFDIFGASYAQVGPVDWVAESPELAKGIRALLTAGYKEIVLVGHSCGGIIARRFVEFHPDAGVTKVVAVASPHLGSGWAKLPTQVLPRTQLLFINSLLPEARLQMARTPTKALDEKVQFGCVVCKLPRLNSDTTVGVDSQWPADLQKLGIPAALVQCNHFDAMKCEKGVKAIADLTRGTIVRWTPREVEAAQRVLFGPVK